MNIRLGTIIDFKKLDQPWAWGQAEWQRAAQKKTIEGIKKKTQEFWVIEEHDDLIGELHLYWKDEDIDQANGKNRAYLSALRIHPDFRGKGLATKLMQQVLKRIKDNGFTEATIGSYENEPHLQKLYNKWGFTEFVKSAFEETDEFKAKYLLWLQRL